VAATTYLLGPVSGKLKTTLGLTDKILTITFKRSYF